MSETPILREATPADLTQIVPLCLASVDTSIPGVTFSNAPSHEPGLVHTKLRERLFPPRSLKTYVLELPSSGEIVAYGNIKPAPTPERDEVDMFFVKIGKEGRGYGGMLMEAMQREWTERGAGGLQLYVFKKNARAIRFYEKMGFHVVEGGDVKWELELKELVEETVCLMHWDPSPPSRG